MAPTLTGSSDGPHMITSNAPLALGLGCIPEGRPMTSTGRSATVLPLVVRTARSERAAAPSPSFALSHAMNRQVIACCCRCMP